MFAKFALIFLLATGSAVSSPFPLTQAPSQTDDRWYSPPAGYEAASPGEVLKFRAAPGNLTTAFENVSAAYNILFRTTNSHYEPTWAVTTVLVPSDPRGHSMVSYQIPYNTADVYQSPSFVLSDPYYADSLVGSDISTMLGNGWYVNVPDFEGPLASFTAGVLEGHATLDSIRAALASKDKLGCSQTPRVALWGYSGGSIASEFASELQVQYAPELEIAGVAVGGVLANGSNALYHLNDGPFSGDVPAALVGLSTQWPAVLKQLKQSLKTTGPYNASTFWNVRNEGFGQANPIFQNEDIFMFFKDGQAILKTPALRQAANQDGIMGYHGVPQSPLYVYKAVHDEASPIGDTDELVSRYCAVGGNILYERNSIGGHLAEYTNGDQHALNWLSGVLNGTYQHSGCTIRNVAINVTSSPI